MKNIYKIALINNGSNSIEALIQLISKYGEVITINITEISNINFDNFNLIVLSGSSTNGLEDVHSHYLNELKVIENCNRILGICMGFELICYVYGGEFRVLDQKDISIRDIKFNNNIYKVKEAHTISVNSVSENLVVLASSANGIEIVKHKYKNIIGVQFHPELLVDNTQGDELLEILIKEYILS